MRQMEDVLDVWMFINQCGLMVEFCCIAVLLYCCIAVLLYCCIAVLLCKRHFSMNTNRTV
ncbi:hypothetical protein FGX27_05855 [Xylella fastidiosa subsp. multiplex]|nr:hypothetical protein [Xylella fastidiosa subsp. multiplex]